MKNHQTAGLSRCVKFFTPSSAYRDRKQYNGSVCNLHHNNKFEKKSAGGFFNQRRQRQGRQQCTIFYLHNVKILDSYSSINRHSFPSFLIQWETMRCAAGARTALMNITAAKVRVFVKKS
jgi:hypothetical protein